MTDDISITGTVTSPSVPGSEFNDPNGRFSISNNTTNSPSVALTYSGTNISPTSGSIVTGTPATITTTSTGLITVGNNPPSTSGNVTFTLKKSPRED